MTKPERIAALHALERVDMVLRSAGSKQLEVGKTANYWEQATYSTSDSPFGLHVPEISR